jgi:hypothetical protein
VAKGRACALKRYGAQAGKGLRRLYPRRLDFILDLKLEIPRNVMSA